MEAKVGDVVKVKGYVSQYEGISLTITRIESGRFCYFKETKSKDNNANFSMDMITEIVTNKEINQYEIY